MKQQKQRTFSPDMYGQFIVDFVNAETILAAYCVLFDNIYKLFETDPWFLQEVKSIKELLYDNFLSEFNELEKKVVDLKMQEAEALFILHEANDIIKHAVIVSGIPAEEELKKERKYLRFEDFDAVKKLLIFSLQPEDLSEKKILPKPKKKIISFSDSQLTAYYQREYKKLMNIHEEMEKIKNQISENRFRDIAVKTMDKLNYVIDREGNLSMIRGVLGHFLEELSLTSDLRRTSLIETILHTYNEKPRDYYLDYEDGILKESSPFNAFDFSEWIGGYGNERFMFAWNNLIFRVCCFSVIQFIDKEKNRKRLKKCPHCNLFFIAKDNKRKRCYSEHCKREYEKQKKQKQRNDHPEIYV